MVDILDDVLVADHQDNHCADEKQQQDPEQANIVILHVFIGYYKSTTYI